MLVYQRVIKQQVNHVGIQRNLSGIIISGNPDRTAACFGGWSGRGGHGHLCHFRNSWRFHHRNTGGLTNNCTISSISHWLLLGESVHEVFFLDFREEVGFESNRFTERCRYAAPVGAAPVANHPFQLPVVKHATIWTSHWSSDHLILS